MGKTHPKGYSERYLALEAYLTVTQTMEVGNRRSNREHGLSFDRLWGPFSPFLGCYCANDVVSFEELLQSLN